MQGRIVSEGHQVPSWVQLEAEERLLFFGQTNKRVRNPTAGTESVPEAALVTDRRVICLSRVAGRGGAQPTLTTLPIRSVQAIQTVRVRWDARMVLLCIIAFLFYLIPGVIFLIWMAKNSGASVHIVSGNLRTEVKFFPDDTVLLKQFLDALTAEACPPRAHV